MLVQAREGGLRLVRQHDHALAAGRIAHAWDAPRLPFRPVLAVALHDVAWRALDRRPSLDPGTGRPCPFHRHLLPEKLEAYRRGLDEMEALDPWAGLLGSLHYASFLDRDAALAFLRREEARRARLRAALAARDRGSEGRAAPGPDGAPGGGTPEEGVDRRARRWLRWLKFFDGLSLRLCLAPPDVPDRSVPAWMDRGAALEPPEGPAVELGWRGPDRAVLDPFPLERPLELEVPFRELPARRYRGQGELSRAWEAAPERTWRPVLSPPPP